MCLFTFLYVGVHEKPKSSKGVKFNMNIEDMYDTCNSRELSLDTDSGVASQNSSNGGFQQQDFGEDFDDQFKPANSGNACSLSERIHNFLYKYGIFSVQNFKFITFLTFI